MYFPVPKSITSAPHYLHAVSIIHRLIKEGHTAYFAGGWVRDLIQGTPSADIDIATSAHPQQVRRLFPKNVAVGAAFGVIIVLEADFSYEVASFRNDGAYVDGRKPTSVSWSSPEEDALRRDFTINGLFFNPLTQEVIDYIGGEADIYQKIIRAIGDPYKRFEEDRLRIVRAARFAHRFNFQLESHTREAILAFAPSLREKVSVERLWQELKKMHQHGSFAEGLLLLYDLTLLQELFKPALKFFLRKDILEHLLRCHEIPKQVPLILVLADFLSFLPNNERMDLLKGFKPTREEIKWVEEFQRAEILYLTQTPFEMAQWVEIDALPNEPILAHLCLQRLPPALSTLQRENRQARHSMHGRTIHRLKEGKSIIVAADLQPWNITPGPRMGEILRAAERIARNHNLHEKSAILFLLQREFHELNSPHG